MVITTGDDFIGDQDNPHDLAEQFERPSQTDISNCLDGPPSFTGWRGVKGFSQLA
jgi:hypothetical protein